MRFGVSSIIAFRTGIRDALIFAQNHEFDHVNIFVSEPHFSLSSSERDLRNLSKFIRDIGLEISLKAPSFVQNLSSLDDNIGKLATRHYEQVIDIANILDANAVIIRAGMLFYPERKHLEKTLQITLDRLGYILEKAESSSVKLLIENYPYSFDLVRSFRDMLWIQRHLDKIHFALNIPHLLESRQNENVIEDINLIKIDNFIIGPPPSPYHVPYDVKGLNRVIELYHRISKSKNSDIILASIRRDLVQQLRKMISEGK